MLKKEVQNRGEIIIYKTSKNKVHLDVHLAEETVWLTQNQIALLFGTQRPAITKHLASIFKSGELNKNSVSSILEHTATDAKIYKTQFYNLDVIISIGYRVNSTRATQFRIWATQTLANHLVKGYTINKKRLLETQKRFKELRETIVFLQEKIQRETLSGQEGAILNLLFTYAKTLSTLEAYDKGTFKNVKGAKTRFVLKYEDCAQIIRTMKKELFGKKQSGDLFGNEREDSFDGIIKGLYQTFDKKQLYPNIQDKASHLLYFVIKDHPFSDGNKRIASFLFVYFLDRADYLHIKSGERKINDNALAALAILIAESDPQEKEVMVALIKNLITEE